MRSNPDPLRKSLGRALGNLAAADARLLAPVWEEVVGPILAQQSSPRSLESSTLTVGVSSPAWRDALEGERGRIIARLADVLGSDRIKGLRFVVS